MDERAAERVSRGEMIALLRSVADAMERGEACEVHIGDQKIYVPGQAEVEVEYSREGDDEELEIELTWNRAQKPRKSNLPAKAGLGLAVVAAGIGAGVALLDYVKQRRESDSAPAESPSEIPQPDPQEG